MKALRSLAIFVTATGFAASLFAQAATGKVYARSTTSRAACCPA